MKAFPKKQLIKKLSQAIFETGLANSARDLLPSLKSLAAALATNASVKRFLMAPTRSLAMKQRYMDDYCHAANASDSFKKVIYLIIEFDLVNNLQEVCDQLTLDLDSRQGITHMRVEYATGERQRAEKLLTFLLHDEGIKQPNVTYQESPALKKGLRILWDYQCFDASLRRFEQKIRQYLMGVV